MAIAFSAVQDTLQGHPGTLGTTNLTVEKSKSVVYMLIYETAGPNDTWYPVRRSNSKLSDYIKEARLSSRVRQVFHRYSRYLQITMSAEKVPLSEVAPVCAWRRQSKAKLAPPAATDFEKKTVLLIGATGAILGEAARILADLQPATLIFGVRNVKKGEALADRLRKTRPQLDIKVWEVDFLSFDSVKQLATTINEHGRIDAIVMGTAAVQTETKITKDGWEESK